MSKPPRQRLHLPDRELSWKFSRASGPGGQSVNTTDSKVEVLWPLAASSALTDEQKELAGRRLAARMTDGVVSVVAREYKSQHRNREAAKARLEELVTRAIVPPRPRRATKPSRASQQRRLDAKKRRGDTKRGRGGAWE